MDNVFRRYWTAQEQTRLLAQPKSSTSPLARRDAACLQLLISCGFRIEEFSRLDIADATEALASGWLFLPREIRKGGQVDHQVPVTQPVHEALSALIKIHREMGGSGEPDQPLVLSRKHRRMSVRGYQFKVAKWCRAAGIAGSPHYARHTRAMNIMRKSTSPDPRGLVKSALGHATLEASAAYVGMTKEDLKRELEKIDGAPAVRKQDLRRRYEERRAA